MTSINAIENKVSSVKKYLLILDRYQGLAQTDIENDIDIRGAIERYLYLAIQSAIDLAESIISYRRLRKPTTMGDSFHILSEAGIIDQALMQKLIQMTGFRNVIAHAYDDLDYSIVFDALHNGKKDIIALLEAFERAGL